MVAEKEYQLTVIISIKGRVTLGAWTERRMRSMGIWPKAPGELWTAAWMRALCLAESGGIGRIRQRKI
jgi:hypothetical protein